MPQIADAVNSQYTVWLPASCGNSYNFIHQIQLLYGSSPMPFAAWAVVVLNLAQNQFAFV